MSTTRTYHPSIQAIALVAFFGLCLCWAASCEPGKVTTEAPATESQQETATEPINLPDAIQQDNAPTERLAPPDAPTEPHPTPDTPQEARAEATPEPISKEAVAADDNPPEPTQPEPTHPEPPPERSPTDEGGSSQSPITTSITQATDVVTAYLLSGSSWNYFHGATVKLGRHSNVGNTSYMTAFRFQQLDIPQGATITAAYISWFPHNEIDSNNRLMINIYAEKTDNSAPYNPSNYTQGRPDQRLKTSAKIDRWIVRCRDDCSSDVSSPKYEYDCPQRKKDCWDRTQRYQCPKDLKAILQEVISQPSWKRGHAISLFLFNAASDQEGPNYKDSRTLIGYDAATTQNAPQLTIHFQP